MDIRMKVGDYVKLTSVPDWLVHDLPPDEKSEIQACIGKILAIEEIDNNGYYWLGFGNTVEDGQNAYYSGHSFCVSKECLQKI